MTYNGTPVTDEPTEVGVDDDKFRVVVLDDVDSGYKSFVIEVQDAFDDDEIFAWSRRSDDAVNPGSRSPRYNTPADYDDLKFVVIGVSETGEVLVDDPVLRVKPKT